MEGFELVLEQVLHLQVDPLRQSFHNEDLLGVDLPDDADLLVLVDAEIFHLLVLFVT